MIGVQHLACIVHYQDGIVQIVEGGQQKFKMGVGVNVHIVVEL
jgi:hypothetical protein